MRHTSPVTGSFWHYRAFDSAGVLLYLGVTGNPQRRMQQHRSRSSWMVEVAWMSWTAAGVDQRSAHRAEAAAIEAERPLYGTTPKEARQRRQRVRLEAHAAGFRCIDAGCRSCPPGAPMVAFVTDQLERRVARSRAEAAA